jgi:3-(3-hydroxy-phenyl)propionate hydroxylase
MPMARFDHIPVWRRYGATPCREAGAREELQTLIVGGGPIGLSLALDLGRRGRKVVLVNALPFIPRGSKAICFSKRSLEIFDRLGVGDRLLAKGVVWEKGKVFWRGALEPIYEFDLLPIKDQKFPAFINIQQYYVEEYLLDEITKFPNIDVRWGHEAAAVRPRADGVEVEIETPEGCYTVDTEYLLACDGGKSPIRNMLGLDFAGRVFEDNFLIADVKFKQERPAERWFHFDPPWPGASSLIHKQPDGVWRLDFQLGWNIDKKEAVKPENVEPFVRGMLGPDVDFEFEWLSVYTFQCRRMERFVHGRVIFAGDSAHLVSPFGARGCNGGMQDVDNLGWKLDRVLNRASPPSFLQSYDEEATVVADVNILNSTRSTDFMTPKSNAARIFRDAVLELARDHAFARPFVNSGRLSQVVSYANSALTTADIDPFGAGPPPGAAMIDAPLSGESDDKPWLLKHFGDSFKLLVFPGFAEDFCGLDAALGKEIPLVIAAERREQAGLAHLIARDGLASRRYDALGGGAYLIRPDQHVAARWRNIDPARIRAAFNRAAGIGGSNAASSQS